MQQDPVYPTTLADGLAITAMALISAAVVAGAILSSLGAFTS
jgi:hypothetical protein